MRFKAFRMNEFYPKERETQEENKRNKKKTEGKQEE